MRASFNNNNMAKPRRDLAMEDYIYSDGEARMHTRLVSVGKGAV